MTQLQRRTETFAGTDQRWIGSREGTDTARTVTLDHDSWSSKVVNGRLKGGEAMKKSGDKYIPAAGSAAEGYLLNDVPFRVDGGDKVVPMLDRGRIVLKYLPTAVTAGNVGTHFIAVVV